MLRIPDNDKAREDRDLDSIIVGKGLAIRRIISDVEHHLARLTAYNAEYGLTEEDVWNVWSQVDSNVRSILPRSLTPDEKRRRDIRKVEKLLADYISRPKPASQGIHLSIVKIRPDTKETGIVDIECECGISFTVTTEEILDPNLITLAHDDAILAKTGDGPSESNDNDLANGDHTSDDEPTVQDQAEEGSDRIYFTEHGAVEREPDFVNPVTQEPASGPSFAFPTDDPFAEQRADRVHRVPHDADEEE